MPIEIVKTIQGVIKTADYDHDPHLFIGVRATEPLSEELSIETIFPWDFLLQHQSDDGFYSCDDLIGKEITIKIEVIFE